MTKAVIMNSARYMTGAGANDTLPSNNQGMGLANLNNYFDILAQARIVRDEVNTDRFTASGQQRTFAGTLVDPTKPVRVTLAWTDAPGSTTGNAFVNNLDLEVVVGGQTFLGNVFNGPNSVAGGSADIRDNVESVFVPAGVTGNIVVRVKATNIAGDGVPGNGAPLDQDFALVVSNTNEIPVSTIQGDTVTVTAENGTPANQSPDPGETVTVDLTLQEVGTANSGAVTATLVPGGGILPITTVQDYGTLNVGQRVTKPFQFSVAAGRACGSEITLTFAIKDGANPPVPFLKTFRLGTQVATPATFNNPTAINLPDGPNFPTRASLYPSNIVVNGVTTAAAGYKITMTVKGWSHTFPADNSFLLVGPNGQKFVPVSLGGGSAISNVNLTLADDAASAISTTQIVSGTFRPLAINLNFDFPSPAPARPYTFPAPAGAATFTSSFGSSDPNGTWSLYIVDVAPEDSGSISGGWSLTVTPIVDVCSTVQSVGSRAPFDFDGDAKTDVSIFRPSDATWWHQRSSDTQVRAVQFGNGTDKVAASDFTGDGKTDTAFFRPSTGEWFVLRSEDESFFAFRFGTNGDIPMPADFDGDGKADPAVFRPSQGVWFILRSSDGQTTITQFGANGDQPVAADYDGDGKDDLAIIRRNAGNLEWWIQRSSAGLSAVVFGLTDDEAVPGDYTGDGKTDVAVWRRSNGTWFVLKSEDLSLFALPFGQNGDVPVPGDYDGDGKTDTAVFRPSSASWFINRSTQGVQFVGFGLATDQPVPNAFVR
jgi:hypothetical protein